MEEANVCPDPISFIYIKIRSKSKLNKKNILLFLDI